MEILPSLSDIKRLRKKLNISQKTLGEILKLSQSIISRIESGAVDPPYSKLKRIYEYLENERKIREKSKNHAEDIMVQSIISIKSSSTIKKAVDLMNRHQISQLPIIESNQNIGSITSKKIQKIETPTFATKPEVDLTRLDTLVATELEIPLNYLEDNVDSLYHVYDRYYTSRNVIPKTLFTIAYICETFKKDTLLADSVYQRLIAKYPEDPLARQARKKIRSVEVIDPETAIAKKFQSAEKAYIDNKKYDDAIKTFESIYQQAPSSEYAPKALLAMGWIYEQGIQQYDKAFDIYQNLINDYPTSVYAKKIKPKVDEVIKARSSKEEEKDAADKESQVDLERSKTGTDTTQVADLSAMDKDEYRRFLRLEMEKSDPRRKTPARW